MADSYSVLRGPFDQWLASKAEEAGAEYICGIAVEELLKDGSGRVTGIRAGEDEITSQVVILCEGCNTILSERCLGNPRPKPSQMAVGIKEVFELPANVIEDRFLVPEREGAAMLFVGDCTHGNVGGGFLYTNKTSISLGLVATISKAESADNQVSVYQMLEDFKNHPAVAPIIRGAKVVEHSGHMVPKGGEKGGDGFGVVRFRWLRLRGTRSSGCAAAKARARAACACGWLAWTVAATGSAVADGCAAGRSDTSAFGWGRPQ